MSKMAVGQYSPVVDEKDIEKITEHLYRWKDPSRLVPYPHLIVRAGEDYQVDEDDWYRKGKYYSANYVDDDILKLEFHLTDSEMELVLMTRKLRDDFLKYPDKMDKLAKEYNDSLNAKLKELNIETVDKEKERGRDV